MNTLTLKPISKIEGEVNLPGSKSLSNRALLLAALAEGTTKITNLLESDDTRHMLNALKQLGITYTLSADKTECTVTGNAGAIQSDNLQELFLGNAGTAMRPLCAALCLGRGSYLLTGEPRMKERPIGHLVDALREAGATISYRENEGYPPLLIEANGLLGGDVRIDGAISSQFLTALLLAAPLAKEDMTITIIGELVSKPYIDITLHIMKEFGVEVENDNYQTFKVKGGQSYQAVETFMVEGDASSASYFLAAAAIKGGTVKVTGIGKKSIQGDVQFVDVLEKMGAIVEWGDEYVAVSRGELHPIDMDFNHIPDAAMTIATTALFAEGTTTLRNIYNWRVKETDRLFAMATELRKVGAEVEEGEDYLKITPPKQLKHAAIDTYDDHRMAMCFSLLALDPVSVTINEPECTAKTFPTYFKVLESISS
ncbi:3-phosphoshikimate 1-carboxyvinyltransferase [Sulfurovum sp. XGS-02]|uniref:3-phosphoshikimate 1-carboxyvinyltransferase n=1 Tax=Sulfurovum sp. XGS-02 TaxID=2925411 RepID=UPI002049914E|nr:3-phosphoshikimate 1-carboxyvinyltransferase [Sulfurovum sp. XGS-02]UPT78031.1 3-phosphoshikimate 1-carboxyvinyltransferase [Sulfurovum sp. XGS-02]